MNDKRDLSNTHTFGNQPFNDLNKPNFNDSIYNNNFQIQNALSNALNNPFLIKNLTYLI